MLLFEDTIAAQATPPGRGGVGIIRLSGMGTNAIAIGLLGGVPSPRRAVLRRFLDESGETIDSGLVLYFPGPRSFTGEDVLELHAHGGQIIIDLLLERVLQLGARTARPGEFSQRAFLNGKLDLVQAEAIADLIDSASVQAARSAQRTLQGQFSERIQSLMTQVTGLRVQVEAAMDFPEEEIDFLSDAGVAKRLDELSQLLAQTVSSARTGRLLREGLTVVIAGKTNVGKSSLLNRLSERDSAIVTSIPGTTRDLLRETIQIDGLTLHLVDTAGLRTTSDVVERHGVARAWKAIESADIILLMVDDRGAGIGAQEQAALAQVGPSSQVIVVRNKVDLSGALPGLVLGAEVVTVRISASTGAGLELLKAQLKATAGYQQNTEGLFLARRRHLEALQKTEMALNCARRQLYAHAPVELVAEDLWDAHHALGEITGEFSSEELLERIFSSFCIGK
ncbi:MAG: tRNA uridine-5-carboxymethylaminomethyl(34) synthesis GTPase MnmE [Gammaproteobacteria bacterium]